MYPAGPDPIIKTFVCFVGFSLIQKLYKDKWLKLKGILLSEGMHGMISQVEGLAEALDLEFTHHTVELDNFWKLFPPKVTPISQKTFKKN